MLLHVIPHNCSEMHRNAAIPDYRSLVMQTSGWTFCQIGYDICEFDSSRDFWQFLKPWHGRWYEYKIFIASCTDNIHDLENERWLLEDMIDHVGIYGSRVAEGLSAFNVGLVVYSFILLCHFFIWTTWTLMFIVRKRPLNLIIHSLTEPMLCYQLDS